MRKNNVVSFILIILYLVFLVGCQINPFECQHNWSKHLWGGDPTGHYYHCLKCGDKKDEEAHTMTEWIVLEEATEEKEGKQYHKCTICGYEKTIYIPKVEHVHTLIHHEKIIPVCEGVGREEYYECEKCEKCYKTIEAKEEDLIEDLDSLTIYKYHEYSNEFDLELPDTNSFGKVFFFCDCGLCMNYIDIPRISAINTDFYYFETINEGCYSEVYSAYYLKESGIRTSIEEKIGNYVSVELIDSYIKKMKDDGLFDEPIFEIRNFNAHHYMVAMIENPTLYDSGVYQVYCDKCNEVILNNENEQTTVIPAGIDGCYYLEKSISSTCNSNGKAIYNFEYDKLIEHIHENYSHDEYISQRYIDADSVNLPECEVILEKLDHRLEGILINPTINTTGSFELKCTSCSTIYSNTDSKSVEIPLLSDKELFDYVCTATCEEDGVETYSYKQDVLIDLISRTLEVDSNIVNKAIEPFKLDISFDVSAYGHSFSEHKMEIREFPSYENSGVLVFPCDDENCNFLREVTESIYEISIPNVKNDYTYYLKTNCTSTCSSPGTMEISLSEQWIKEVVPTAWTDYNEYIKNDTVTPQLTNFLIDVDVAPHEMLYKIDYELLQATAYCSYGCERKYTLQLPELSSDCYKVQTTEATCVSVEMKLYTVTYSKVFALLQTFDDVPEGISISSFANNITNKFRYRINGEKNPNNHVGTIAFDESYDIVFPRYSKGSDMIGNYAYCCSECHERTYYNFKFSEGTWTKYSSYATRLYVLDGKTYVDPNKYYSFSINIECDKGVIYSEDIVMSTTVSASSKAVFEMATYDFKKNGADAKGFEVYIDNVRYYASKNPVSIRTSLSVVYVTIDFSKGVGNIYIKVVH